MYQLTMHCHLRPSDVMPLLPKMFMGRRIPPT